MLRNLKQKKKEIRRRKGNESNFFSMPFDTSSIETRKDQQVMKIFAFAEKSWSGGSKRNLDLEWGVEKKRRKGRN